MSQGTKRIVVFSNANGQRLVLENSEHKTFKTLKDELTREGFDLSRLDAVVRGTRTTLQLDSAVLPEGDFTLLLVEKEMKSGGAKKDAKKAAKKARKEAKAKIKAVTTEEADEEVTLILNEAKEKISLVFDKLHLSAKQGIDLFDGLKEEAEEITESRK